MKKRSVFIICIILVLLFTCSAVALTDLSVTRVLQQDRSIYVYMDAYDEQNRTVVPVDAATQINVSIDGDTLPVSSLKTIDSYGAGVHYVLVMDNSRKATDSWPEARKAVQVLLNGLNSADRVSLIVSSHNGVESIFTFESSSNLELSKKVENIRTATSSENTKFYDALKLAVHTALQTETSPLMARVIIAYTHVNIDDVSTNLTVEELDDLLFDSQIPLYVVSCGDDSSKLNDIARAARTSGGMFSSTNRYSEITDLMLAMQRRVKGSYLLQADASQITRDYQGLIQVSVSIGQVKEERKVSLSLEAAEIDSPEISDTPTIVPTFTPSPSPVPTAFAVSDVVADSTASANGVSSSLDFLHYIVIGAVAVLIFLAVLFMVFRHSSSQPKKKGDSILVTPNPLLTLRKNYLIPDIAKTICDKQLKDRGGDALAKTISSKQIEENGIAVSFSIRLRKVDTAKLKDAGVFNMFIRGDDMNGFIIGRAPSCDLQIDEGHVSGEHAVIIYALSQLMIRNESKTNATLVNGNKVIQPRHLHSGDVISLAENVEITVTFSE